MVSHSLWDLFLVCFFEFVTDEENKLHDSIEDYYYTKFLHRWGDDADTNGINLLFIHVGDIYRTYRRKARIEKRTRRAVKRYLKASANQV